MDGFITSEVLLSFTGCVGIVIAATQVFKKYSSLSSKVLAAIFSVLIGVARIIVSGRTSFGEIFMGLVNILPILCGAMGGYDAIIKSKTMKSSTVNKTTTTITTPNDVIQKAENVIITNIDPATASNLITAESNTTSKDTNSG